MAYQELPCAEFIELLASAEPVPGGGGASALVGALAAALGNMVGSLTIGKKKYAEVQDEIIALKAQSDALQAEFLQLIDADAEAFAPLAAAYGLPVESEAQKEHKALVMRSALEIASSVPVQIMSAACRAVELAERFAAIGSVIAISDAGVSALFAKAALQGAALNVYINTRLMQDRKMADQLNQQCEKMLAEYAERAEQLHRSIEERLKKARV